MREDSNSNLSYAIFALAILDIVFDQFCKHTPDKRFLVGTLCAAS